MQKIQGSHPDLVIVVMDEPGAGGANHEYEIASNQQGCLTQISFQRGPVQENGVNGCQNEDLLAIVVDRLERFQKGPFPCFENQIALQRCREALGWLEARTRDRQRRGLEGKSEA